QSVRRDAFTLSADPLPSLPRSARPLGLGWGTRVRLDRARAVGVECSRRGGGTGMAIGATNDQQERPWLGGEVEARPERGQRLLSDRHELDAMARAIVSGERGLGGAADAIVDAVASLMINRLEAAGVAGHQRVAHLPWNEPERRLHFERLMGRELLEALI